MDTILKRYHKYLKNSDTRTIQLTIAINFGSHRKTDKEHVMHSKRDNIEVMINDKADKVFEKHFQSRLSRYQIWLETLVKGSDFNFNCGHLLYYKCHRINFKLGKSYMILVIG